MIRFFFRVEASQGVLIIVPSHADDIRGLDQLYWFWLKAPPSWLRSVGHVFLGVCV
jgi:hypothetical protein